MTPLERAARALAESDYPPDPRPDEWRQLLPAVRAVLIAIREPSDGMVKAGQAHIYVMKDEVAEAWQAMIDAALSEGTGK